MTTKSYVLNSNLFLVRQSVTQQAKAQALPAATPTNHIMVVDRSGSMHYDLPALREHIKSKLPRLMKKEDTLTIIAFSSRGECEEIITGEPVTTLTELADVQEAIDQGLRSRGMTGFVDPLNKLLSVIAGLAKKNSNPASLLFLSDGYENQSSKSDVLKAVEAVAPLVAAATVVAYSFYADLAFLTTMAEKFGGTLIQSTEMVKFTPALDNALCKQVVGTGKKTSVDLLDRDLVEGVVFSLVDGEILTFLPEGGSVTIPESVTEVFYLSTTVVGEKVRGNVGTTLKNFAKGNAAYKERHNGIIAAAYAAISLFAVRMKPDVVLDLLKATGDVRFIADFAKLFGKDRYLAFQQEAAKAAFDPSFRLVDGWDPNKVPREDAFTIMELLQLLQSDDGNRVLLNSPEFKYNRIGRKTVDGNLRLTKEEQAELATLQASLGGLKDIAKIKEVTARISELANKPEPLKFVEKENKDGYTVDKLVFNEDRPNVSIMVRKEGTVDLSSRKEPTSMMGREEVKAFPTFIFRNYTIIKDGLPNVELLPVRLTTATWDALKSAMTSGRLGSGVLGGTTSWDAGMRECVDTVLDLSQMAITNRQNTKAISARKLFEAHYELTKARAAQKVFKALLEGLPAVEGKGGKSLGFLKQYGQEGAAWLKEQGITDYSGFSPKVVVAESTDVYMSKVLEVKMKGYSTLPSMADFRKQMEANKLNGPGQLMKLAYDHFVDLTKRTDKKMIDDPVNSAGFDRQRFERDWLEGCLFQATRKVRQQLFTVADMKTSLIVSQTWFCDLPLDETKMSLTLDGQQFDFETVLAEKEEKI